MSAGVESRVIEAAIEEFTEYGIRRVNVEDIARRAGVHRVTVYRYFKNKDEVVTAAAIAWLGRYFTRIGSAVKDLPTIEERLVEGFALALHTIRTEPLAIRVVQSEPETALPYLTTNGGATIAACRMFFAAQLRVASDLPEDVDLDGVAEMVTRTGMSLLMTPDSYLDLHDLDAIRRFARTYIAPLLSARNRQ
ncbi:TetR/AcrR family transcriptional regulator [Smaragdicoccus niigatensis]|uniref:TetR/AcrR family transcriptional regulator n=1 Tax=Smaragdicoccus niigatensis TaxID=359359 RepID=UPI0003A4AB9F|nr:TetR/AcrR family transcriptional regulator [Smaragdicoccus niigatensis]